MPSVYYYPGLPHVEFAETLQCDWREAGEERHEDIAVAARELPA